MTGFRVACYDCRHQWRCQGLSFYQRRWFWPGRTGNKRRAARITLMTFTTGLMA